MRIIRPRPVRNETWSAEERLAPEGNITRHRFAGNRRGDLIAGQGGLGDAEWTPLAGVVRSSSIERRMRRVALLPGAPLCKHARNDW